MKPTSPWEPYSKTWDKTEDDNYVIHDLVCPEFDNLLKVHDAKQMREFAHLLDNYWEKYFRDKDVTRPTCKLATTSGDKLKLVYSSFYLKV
jgi:hypothetical protein